MSLFKKKITTPNLFLLLEEAKLRAEQANKTCFYYALYDNEVTIAQEWCEHNKIRFELDHKTEGNKIYKFII